jgi:transcriptional regulator with XRE-family HTH domain
MSRQEIEQLRLEIGAKIRDLRFKKRIKQKDLADAISIHPMRLSRIEHGEVEITPGELYLICKFFSYPIEHMFKVANDMDG